MNESDPFLTDEWKNLPRKTREVRFEEDGTTWTESRDPVMRERIVDVYRRLCETGETGRQIVAVHQEICADLVALIRRKKRRSARVPRRTGKVRATAYVGPLHGASEPRRSAKVRRQLDARE